MCCEVSVNVTASYQSISHSQRIFCRAESGAGKKILRFIMNVLIFTNVCLHKDQSHSPQGGMLYIWSFCAQSTHSQPTEPDSTHKILVPGHKMSNFLCLAAKRPHGKFASVHMKLRLKMSSLFTERCETFRNVSQKKASSSASVQHLYGFMHSALCSVGGHGGWWWAYSWLHVASDAAPINVFLLTVCLCLTLPHRNLQFNVFLSSGSLSVQSSTSETRETQRAGHRGRRCSHVSLIRAADDSSVSTNLED